MNKPKIIAAILVSMLASFLTQAIIAYSSSQDGAVSDKNKIIYARAFYLVDSGGKQKGSMKLDKIGVPSVTLLRESNNRLISIDLMMNNPYVSLNRKSGNSGVGMNISLGNYPTIGVGYRNGISAAELKLSRTIPLVSINHAGGKSAIEMLSWIANGIRISQPGNKYKIIR